MGTAAYMSPEQARGNPLAKRSDVFSFGCVLIDTLTGSGPFGDDTQVSTEGGAEPLWARDGKSLYFRSGRRLMATAVRTDPVFSAERAVPLLE